MRRVRSMFFCLLWVASCNLPNRLPQDGNILPSSPALPTVMLPTPLESRLSTQPALPSATASGDVSSTPELLPSETPRPTPTNPPPADVPAPQNIILIIVDTLRAGHVTSYGYERPTTPNLDALLTEEGVRFQNVVSTSPWTCPSMAAMFTGLTPTSLNATFANMENSLPRSANTLAEYLRRAGYYTAGFATTWCVRSRWGYSQGFRYYDDSLHSRPTSNKGRASEVNQKVMKWLERKWLPQSGPQPLFLFIHYFDPHSWYDPPAPYDTLYDPEYNGPLTPEIYQDGEDVVAGKITPTPRDVEHLLAMYDGEITYWDSQFKEMMTFLQDRGLLERSLVVLVSDHGELFGEHGKWAHGNSLYNELTHVPMVMRYSGVIPAGRVVSAAVQNYDLMPTILDFAGIPISDKIQAVSLKNQALAQPGDPLRPLFSEVSALTNPRHSLYWTAPHVELRALEQQEWKYIHSVGQPEMDELYRLEPGSRIENEDLAQGQPDLVRQLFRTLAAFFNIQG